MINMDKFKSNKTEDLRDELINTREKLRLIRFEKAGSRAKNVKETRSLKKLVAQILTELQSRG